MSEENKNIWYQEDDLLKSPPAGCQQQWEEHMRRRGDFLGLPSEAIKTPEEVKKRIEQTQRLFGELI